jgi:predicted ATPase
MSNSREMRRLSAKWAQGTGWPKRLNYIEIKRLRGWDGQKIPFNFPIVALVGENGSGKSTVLQCAASVYKPPGASQPEEMWFASDFFPKTIWEDVQEAEIRFEYQEGTRTQSDVIRKPGERWRGNPRRPQRSITYKDLRRIQPIAARVGYSKLVKDALKEVSSVAFDKDRLDRFSQIMGWKFDSARMSLTDAHKERVVPVFGEEGLTYSGYNAGAGQTTVAEFLCADLTQYSLVLIDEIETSLHPRAQRRLIRDLAEICRERELQIILSTHSPYVLAELPLEARLYIMQGKRGRHVMTGVSPEFAMTKMDEYSHPECEIYVEDERAQTLMREIIVAHTSGLIERCLMIPFGAASMGRALGVMVAQRRFPRPSCVFLDGDQSEAFGCNLLPGGDAPEPVVFDDLQARGWGNVATRIGRPYANVADACSQVMSLTDHHDWVSAAATRLVVPGETLWQAMCAEWALICLDAATAKTVIQPIADLLLASPKAVSSPTVHLPLFERSVDAFEDQAELRGLGRP